MFVDIWYQQKYLHPSLQAGILRLIKLGVVYNLFDFVKYMRHAALTVRRPSWTADWECYLHH